MKAFHVKSNNNIDFSAEKEKINKDPKVGAHTQTSKYKYIFAKGYTPNCSEEMFVVKKVKSTVPWTYVIEDLNRKEIVGISFYEKNQILKKQQVLIHQNLLKRLI